MALSGGAARRGDHRAGSRPIDPAVLPSRLRATPLRVAESVVLSVLRLVLGGLFVFAAAVKLNERGDIQTMADAIKGYHLIEDPHAIRVLAYTFPFAELLGGLLVIFGAWTRGAALLIAAMLGAFIGAYAKVFVIDGITDKVCSCFGETEVICTGPIGWCHIARNGGFAAAALLISWRGGGMWSVDRVLTMIGVRRAVGRGRAFWVTGASAAASSGVSAGVPSSGA